MARKIPAPTVDYWLGICRAHALDHAELFKRADLGGSGNDVPFAQSFSNLSHAFLADKCPSLLDHELGFQVIDRSEDNKKAVGILAAKIGSQKVFVPLFFLKNGIKGHELLYLCDRDLFVPLEEKWLNDLINRKPDIMGTGINRGDAMRNIVGPNMQRLRQSPYKFGSAVIPAMQPFLPKYASLVAPDAWQEEIAAAQDQYTKVLNLPNFLKRADADTLQRFVGWLQRYPQLAGAVDRFHGFDNVQGIIRKAAADARVNSVFDKSVPKYRAPVITGSVFDKQAAKDLRKSDPSKDVEVIYQDQYEGDKAKTLSDQEKETLLRDRVLIRDSRGDDEVSKPYRIKTPQPLFNPSESGVYMLLVKPGVFEKCFISIHPYGPDKRKDFATVVRLDGDRTWANLYTGNLWCTSEIDGADFAKWFDALPAVTELTASGRKRYMCVGSKGEATVPFYVEKELGDGDGGTLFDVCFSAHSSDRRPGSLGTRRPTSYACDDDDYSEWRDGQRIRVGGRAGSHLRASRGDVIVPPNYRLLRVEPAEGDKEDDDALLPMSTYNHSEKRPIEPGSFFDAELAMREETKELRIGTDGHEYRLNVSKPTSKIAALVSLVRDHGLREDIARDLLKQATSHCPVIVHVKYADQQNQAPYLTHGGPTAPAFPDDMQYTGGYNPMGFAGPTTTSQQQDLPIMELSSNNTDRNKYNPNPAYTEPYYNQPAQDSANDDQQEVFDTAIIGSLLRSMSDESMVDRWLPELLTGMDRLGRLLFTFYWHGDRFADRYGKRDMPELEDSLRNAFQMLGDVVAFLQKKTIRSNPRGVDALVGLGLRVLGVMGSSYADSV
jgi:hypothetical protein